RVIEVPASDPGLDADQVDLGATRVVDLADPDPSISNDGPVFYPINSRSPITWTATDGSGNASQADQLITIKAEGTNTAPLVTDVQASTLTSEPVDVVLTGSDADFLDGRFDPLSFRISDRPDNGEFIAPLYPYFIEDFRTSPGGPYGEAFYLSSNRGAWLYTNVCQTGSGPNADRIRVDWVYEPEFVIVDDSGEAFMQDFYWQCSASDATPRPRISRWDSDGNFIGQIDYQGENDAFVLDRDDFLYEFNIVGSGSSAEVFVNRCATDFVGKADRPAFCDSLGSVDNNSAPNLAANSISYARVDSSQGILYVTDKRRVFAFDIRNDPANPIYLATLNADSPFPTPSPSCAGSSLLGYAMDVDSEGNLYMTNCANERIEKFTSSYFDEGGQFVAGDYVGWMGRCETSSNNACDEDKKISKGYACTDATCTRTDLTGEDPGQFSTPLYIAIDPNDVLYVAEWDNFRVQRFAPDGSFAGQALSTGTGVNQGEQPGFVLGNMGRPRAVSVNSTQFYVVDREEGFVHVFETSPLKDITDDSVTVTYVSNFDFHSATDTFQFIASDGLHDSNVGTVSIDVARNFRAPIAPDQAIGTNEDTPIQITLIAEDPDGIVGFDFNGLDILDFEIVEGPASGSVSVLGSDNRSMTLLYIPDEDVFGQDTLVFVANDGVDDSAPATVTIDIAPIDDPPAVVDNELPQRIGAGFPFVLRGVFEDDGASDFSTYVDWNNESTDEEGGVNDENPDNPFIEGVFLVKPALGEGQGFGIAEHVFTTPGVKDVRFCISDQSEREDCLTTQLTVEALVNLGLELPTEQGETPPPDVPIGDTFTVDVEIGNLLPEGIAGLIAQAVSMTGTIDTPGVTFTGSSEGNCTISGNGQSIECDFGDFAAGEQRMITLSFATDPGLSHNTAAQIRLRFTTASQAVNEITEAFITRTIVDPDIVFSDRFGTP
ncbi:MAG: Ig-like domain-containing protein, partial [Wenzhouxiangella sp.]|nr:Ig-like domain-containing protein [Wenzhouxiangella sp.]